MLMANIKGDGRIVSYTFESKLNDPFDFKGILIDLNTSYASNLKHYMEYKYTVVRSGSEKHRISVVLEACEITTEDAGTESVSFNFAVRTVTMLTVTTTLTVKVRVETNGRVIEEDIVSVAEYTGNIENLTTGQISISMALEGNILLVDRFLNRAFGVESGAESEPVRHSDI
jgi:hypothetical protein